MENKDIIFFKLNGLIQDNTYSISPILIYDHENDVLKEYSCTLIKINDWSIFNTLDKEYYWNKNAGVYNHENGTIIKYKNDFKVIDLKIDNLYNEPIVFWRNEKY